MDIVVKGRNVEVPDHFRAHVAEKLVPSERLDARVFRIDVELAHERNPRQSERCQRVEITCASKGPVIRAEACAADFYAALDAATLKLEARLRKAQDRRKVHHGKKTPVSVAAATAAIDAERSKSDAARDSSATVDDVDGSVETGPLVIREKLHAAAPMDLDQALYEMELVGHDFFLFVDATTSAPSVVYRRRAYDYGVIRLAV